MIDADHIVRGDGIAWMRAFLGEDVTAPIRHPEIVSGFDARTLGIQLPTRKGDTAATIIPSVGCPMGCNFCTTSAFFGGKGKYLNFYDTGDELFDVMCEMEAKLEVKSFFMMDENFLLHKRRAMELLDRMKQSRQELGAVRVLLGQRDPQIHHARNWWSWASRGSGWGWNRRARRYTKLRGRRHAAAHRANCGEHGIKLLGSTIVGLEHHTPENIHGGDRVRRAHDTDFHQFMLYTPVPGTPLFSEMSEQGRMLPNVDLADIHGSTSSTSSTPRSRARIRSVPRLGFPARFRANGPSLYRICRTTLHGWRRYKNFPMRACASASRANQ